MREPRNSGAIGERARLIGMLGVAAAFVWLLAAGGAPDAPRRGTVLEASTYHGPCGFVLFTGGASGRAAPGADDGLFLETIPCGAVTRLTGRTRPAGLDGEIRSPAVDASGRYMAFLAGRAVSAIGAVRSGGVWVLDRETHALARMPASDGSGAGNASSKAYEVRWSPAGPLLGAALDPPFGMRRMLVDGVAIETPQRDMPHTMRLAVWNIPKGTVTVTRQPSGTAWNWLGGSIITMTVSHDRRSVAVRDHGNKPWRESWLLSAAPAGHSGFSTVPPRILPGPGGRRFVINVPHGVYVLERGRTDARRLRDAVNRDVELLLSPDGRFLAAHSRVGVSLSEGFDSRISVYDLATGQSRLLDRWAIGTAALTQDRLPLAWSRDSNWLLVREDRDLGLGPGQIWALNVRTGAKTLIWSCDAPVAGIAWHEGPPPTPLP